MAPFRLIMLSAMYENGGNTTHRLLDGHPELFVYPFESQLGTRLVADRWAGTVPFKYRWPEFPLTGNPADDYELFFDEELKTRLRVPERSKFKDARLDLDEADRKCRFVELLAGQPRTRASIIGAFFQATFDAWKNVQRTGREQTYVGYSPVLVLDTEKILADFPDAHVVHVVRNPYSGYADTKKRPFPLSLPAYAWTWNLCQLMALTYVERFPRDFHLVRFEDLVADPRQTMERLCGRLGLPMSDRVLYASWNGVKLDAVYPWGTIRTPTPAANLATMNELSATEKAEIKSLAGVLLKLLGYDQL